MPRSRTRLSRERVLAGALALIDRDGLEQLSMRRLGGELGVEAMSLYNHVANKDDVLDGVVALLWREIATRSRHEGPWQQQIRDLARAVLATARAHPHAYPLLLRRGALPEELGEVGGPLVAALREAGFGPLAVPAMLAAGSQITSQALAELVWNPPPATTTRTESAVSTGTLPMIESETPFGLSLELLIGGLQARLAGPATPRR